MSLLGMILLAMSEAHAAPAAKPTRQIVLLDAGSEPRSKLTPQFSLADEVLDVSWQSAKVIVSGGMPARHSESPQLETRWNLIKKPLQNGGWAVELWFLAGKALQEQEEPSAENTSRHEAYALALKALHGSKCTLQVQPSLVVSAVTCGGATSVSAGRLLNDFGELASMRLFTPLPGVPVGQGARWQTQQPFPNPVFHKVTETMTYTLETREDDRLEIGLSATYANPVVPFGEAKKNLWTKDFSGSGEGRARVVLSAMVPWLTQYSYKNNGSIEDRTPSKDKTGTMGDAFLVEAQVFLGKPAKQ